MLRTIRTPFVLAAALAVAGCVNQAREVAKYRTIVATPGQLLPNIKPGQALSLEDAMLLANEYNERINLQGEAYLQALVARDRIAGTFLPTISLAPSDFRQQVPSSASGAAGAGTASGISSSLTRSERTDVPLTAGYTSFNGAVALSNYKSAGSTIAQRRALLLDAQAAVLIDVAQTYYQILRAERSVLVLQNTLKLQQERVRDMQYRLKFGLGKQLDVAQSQAQASATRVTLINAQNIVMNARTTLAYLIGVNVFDCPLRDDAIVPGEISLLPELVRQAEQSRQDLIAARAAVESARFAVEAAIGQYFPSVTINLNYYLSRQSFPTDSEWNALLSANIPIFTGGIIEANVRAAWSVLRQTKLLESATRRLVLEDVTIAYQNLMVSRDRLPELQVQVKAAEEARFLAEQQYRAGLARNLDVLAAQDQLLSSQLQFTSERFNQKVFYLTLLRAMGTLSTRLPWESRPTTAPGTQPATRPAPTTAPA